MSSRTLLKGGWVVTMAAGEAPFVGDVLIEDEVIAAVGRLDAVEDAEIVDARRHIVLPGFIDSHRHTWQSALPGIACDWTLAQYFARIRGQLAPRFRPEDTYAGTLLGVAEALDAGITTVVDWSHNINTPEDADNAWQALVDGGGRAIFSYGASNAQALARDGSPHTRDVARMRNGVGSSDSGRVTLGMAVRGPEFSESDAWAHDWGLARELGLPVTVHVGDGLRGANGTIFRLDELGLLGADTTFVHCSMLSDEELDRIAATGGRASVSPEVEANMGHGTPATGRLRERGIVTGLSSDVCTNVGGDMFAAMRVALALQRGADHAAAHGRGQALADVTLTVREILEMATIDSAAACGLDDRIGSLEPGKQADIVVLRGDTPGLVPLIDPVGAAALAAGVHNVDTVFVAGRAVKRNGRLVDLDRTRVMDLAQRSHEHLLAGVNQEEWRTPASGLRV
jgi:cytosine/adenosine deaminase-related metal-dependent hydrolase